MIAAAQLRRVSAAIIRRTCEVPEELTVTQWADKYRMLPETSTSPGPYDSSITPYARRWQDLLGDAETTMVALCWAAQTTKALALDTPIPTPDGWRAMAELAAGDTVFAADGQPTRIVGVSAVASGRPCYEVEFDSGERIVADADHLWAVIDGNRKPSYRRQVVRTVDLLDRAQGSGGRNRWRVPIARAIECEEATLPLPPYVLGAWLGDGHSASARIVVDTRDGVAAEVCAEFPGAIVTPVRAHIANLVLSPDAGESDVCGRGHTKKRYGKWMSCATCTALRQKAKRHGEVLPSIPRSRPGQAFAALADLAVIENKHIPVPYLRASTAQRWALLQGLMDTDGTATTKGQARFSVTSERLATDFAALVASLGMKPLTRCSRAVLAGCDIGPVYIVSFTAYAHHPVFRLKRKQARLRNAADGRPTESGARSIVAVRPVPSVPVRCIAVDAPSRVFLVGRHCIPTHNSTVLENALAYRIARMPTPMLIVQPKIDAAEAYMKERFVPMVMATPALRERVRLGRSTESTLRYKSFPGGFLFAPSAQSATELAARSAPFVELDEVDRYETIPGEGNPAEIVMLRMGAADIGCAALTSTPRDAETTIIWPYLEGGTYELYHVPCPHCGELQPLIWKGLRWEPGAPHTAIYVCGTGLPRREDGTTGGCGAVIEEHHKRWMLAEENGATWVAQFPDAPYPSSHLNGLYSPFAKSNWAALVQQWERAQGKPADLQVFINTRLAELWKETADVVEGNTLLERRGANGEPDLPGLVPNGVGVLTAGVDVQGNRIEVYVWGWGAALESWLVASEILLGDPEREADQPGSVWAALDTVLQKKYEHVAGGTVSISAALIDSGHATSQVYAFTRRRKARKVYAAKGIGGPGIPILGKVSLQTKERVPLWPIGVDSAKTEFLRSQLMEQTPGPGYVHLPEWVTPDQCEQFVAEKRVRRVTRKGLIYEWRKKKDDAANEALDCRNYARAALSLLGSNTIARLGEWAEKLSAAPPIKTASQPTESQQMMAPPKMPRRASGWVTGWNK